MSIVLVNGQPLPGEQAAVAADDAGLLHGDSLFETLRADGRKLLWVSDHLQRLADACRLCDIPFDRDLATRGLDRAAALIPWPAARVRLTVTRGGNQGPMQIICAQPYQPPAADLYRAGVSCGLAPNHRVNPVDHLPQLKRGNYADCAYALRHARQQGHFEAIFIQPDGGLLEGSISNLFLLLDGVLVTPPSGNLILPGIARSRIIATADRLGIPVTVYPLFRDLLPHAEGMMLSNSLFGLLPVRECAGQQLPISSLTATLRRALGKPFAAADSA